MQTKLTLRMEEALVRRAKRYSERSGRSVSRLVSDYFALMDAASPVDAEELTPRVRGLVGALAGGAVTEEDYRRHLEIKHQ